MPLLLQSARDSLGEELSAFEFMDNASIDAVKEVQDAIIHRYVKYLYILYILDAC